MLAGDLYSDPTATIRGASGDVRVRQATGAVRVSTASGDTRIDQADDELSVEAASGDLAVGRIAADVFPQVLVTVGPGRDASDAQFVRRRHDRDVAVVRVAAGVSDRRSRSRAAESVCRVARRNA